MKRKKKKRSSWLFSCRGGQEQQMWDDLRAVRECGRGSVKFVSVPIYFSEWHHYLFFIRSNSLGCPETSVSFLQFVAVNQNIKNLEWSPLGQRTRRSWGRCCQIPRSLNTVPRGPPCLQGATMRKMVESFCQDIQMKGADQSAKSNKRWIF